MILDSLNMGHFSFSHAGGWEGGKSVFPLKGGHDKFFRLLFISSSFFSFFFLGGRGGGNNYPDMQCSYSVAPSP